MTIKKILLVPFGLVLLLYALYSFTPLSLITMITLHQLCKPLTISFKLLQASNSTKMTLVNDCQNNAWPLVYQTDVVALTEKNFSYFIAKNRYVMVMFYASWCHWSKKMAPEYAEAAKILKGEAVLAMVDAYKEKQFKIYAYPSLHFFVGGVKQYVYWEERTRDAITTWVKRKMALPVYNLTTMDEAIYTLNAESRLVLGYLDSLEGSESEELAAASKLQRDINFYQTAKADVAELFNINRQIKRPALTLLQTVSGQSSIFRGQFTRSSIADFVSKSKHPLVVNFTLESAELIFQNPMKQLWLFAPACGSEEVISTFEEAAKAFRGKLLFVYLDINGKGVGRQVAHDFGVTGDAPIIIAYRQHDAKKLVFKGELTLSSIKSFGEDFLEDELLRWSDSTPNSVLELPSHSRASHALRFHHIN